MAEVKGEDPVVPKTTGGGLSDFLTTANKGLDPLRPIADPGFQETQKTIDPVQSRNLDVKKYRPYIENLNPDDKDLDLQRAENQPLMEVLGHSIGQFGTQVVGGAAMSAGTSLDVQQSVNVLKGTEQEYSNLLYDYGKNLIEKSGETMPIYERKPGAVDFSDPAFWGTMFASTGLSAGIMVESLAETAAITALTGGLGDVAIAGKKMRDANTLREMISVGNASEKLRNAATTFGVLNRHHESIMEAADAFKDEYNTLKAKGVPEQTAKDAAAKAASATYIGNLPLLALDILSFKAMTFNPVSGGSTGGLVDKFLEGTLGKIASPALQKAAGYGIEVASEGAEEFWQSLTQEEAKNYADNAYGMGSGKSFSERFKDLSEKGDLWNSTVSGMFGGLILGGITHGFEKIMEGNSKKNLDKVYNDFVQGTVGVGLDLSEKIKAADEAGDATGGNNLRRQMGITKSLQAVHLDNLKDSDSAFTSHIGSLQAVLDAVNSGDAEQIKNAGVEGNEDFIKTHVPAYIKDANQIKSIYDEVKQNNSREAIVPITYRKFLVDNLSTQLMDTNAKIATQQTAIPDLNNLSSTGRTIFEAKTNLKLWDEQLKATEAKLEEETVPEKKDALRSQLNTIQFNINKNQQIVEEQTELTKDQAVNPQDEDIIQSVEDNFSLNKLKQQAVQLESELARTRKELNIWSNPKFQRKNSQGKMLDVISKASSTEELQSAEDNLKDKNILTDEFRQVIAEKKKELSTQEEVDKLKKQNQVTPIVEQSLFSDFLAKQNNPAPVTVASPFGNPQEVTQSEINDLSVNLDRKEIGNAILPTAQGTIVNEDSLFEPATLVDNLTEDQKETIKTKLSDYFTSLSADLGRKPIFKELAEDMINHTSPEQVDRNFNVIKLGWELNNYPATDFNKVYNDLFGNRKSKADEFFNFAEQSVLSKEEYQEEQGGLLDKQEERDALPVQFTETETGQRVFKHINPYQTVVSTLKFAHLSRPYIETRTKEDDGTIGIEKTNSSDELNQSQYVDSKELLDPNKYAVGTKLKVSVPDNKDNILIAQWTPDFQKSTAKTFGEWSQGLDTDSDEYIGRVPMIINSPYSNTGVAFVHDVKWYNPSNIGLEDNPIEQGRVIAEAKAELIAFRRAILSGQVSEIEITERKAGTKSVIPMDKPLITVNEANPQALIGFPNDFGNVVTGSKIIPFTDLINREDLERGHKYDLRQVGLTEEGNPKYFAAKVHYDKIGNEAKMSVVQAIRTYLSQFDTNEYLSKKSEIDKIRKDVKDQSKLDLFDQADLESYLNLFVQTYKGKAKTNKDIASEIESNSKIPNETPYIAISEGRLVFGIKGVKISNSEENGYTLYTHPQNLTKPSAKQLSLMATSILQRIYKEDFLNKMPQNLTSDHLEKNTPISIIKYDLTSKVTSVESQGNYQEYLKGKLKTNLKSYDIGNNTYATFIQPVINFTYEGQGKPVEEVKKASILPTIREVASQITGNVNREKELIDSITGSLEDLSNLGLSPEAMKALNDLTNTKFDPDYASLTDDIVQSIKTKITKITDLDTIDRNTVVQFVANEIMNQIDPQKRNTVNKKDLIDHVNKSFNNIISPKIKVVEDKLSALTELYETGKYPGLKEVIDQFGNLKGNSEILQKNWNFLINEAFEDYIAKFTGISVTMSRDQKTVNVAITDEEASAELNEQEEEQQDWQIDSNDQREKDYSKESVEDNGKNSVSYLIKRFLAQIPSYDKSGHPKKGYMGLTTYPGFDTYYNLIGQIMASPVPVNSSMEDILIRLEQHKEGKPWIPELIDRLSKADQQLQNAFMYNLRENISMKFVMYSYDSKTDNYKLKVYDTNANEILRVIQTRWKEGFKQSPLSIINGEDYNINVNKAQELLNTFNKWTSTKLPTKQEAKDWLTQFGIDISEDAMTELYTKGYYATENKKPVAFPFSKMFEKSSNTNGLFGRLAKYLDTMVAPGTNLNFQENDLVNPFEDSNGILNKLANIESKYSIDVTTNSFRDGSKTIYGYTPRKFATSFLTMLKTDSSIIDAKKQISFDQNSYILDLLENDPEFAAKLNIDHLGINAFKELGKKLYQDNEIQSLSDADHELVKLGMFQDLQQGQVKSTTFNGIPLRIARMFFPTMSDKKTMLSLTTAVLNIKSKDLVFTDSGTELSQQLKEFLSHQLIEPELKRIIAHHKRAKELEVSADTLVNQKGYNKAAQIFHFIPAMNNLMYKNGDGSEIRLIEFLANSAGTIDDKLYPVLLSRIKTDTHALLDTLFNKLANEKISSWEANGYLTKDDKNAITKIKFLNEFYLSSKSGTINEKLITSAMDMVVNYALSNANMHMMLVGDIANYSQDKAFNKKNFEDGNIFKPINESIYANISSDIIGVNLGKRLALLIAPGNTISQSKRDKYVQLFLKDRVSHSDNIEFLIQLYHGSHALSEVKEELNTLNTSKDRDAISKATKLLSEAFPDLGAYFEIESTDAQEYTTAKEHLDILYRQGRISVEKYKDYTSAIENSTELNDDDLQLIFQPIKPVYTGQLNDVANNVSRMVYIKTSSFPLLPQVTKAFPGLDALRLKMEAVEKKSGMNVRASYDTGNKVGAVLGKNQLEIWDAQGNFNEDSIDVDDIVEKLSKGDDTSALVLDREFFRIQQDVPFKSSKIDHQDTNTLGTQMMKEIFGNGISQIRDSIFDINGNKLSGQELNNYYNSLFDQWIGGEKTKLYNQLGIDEKTGEATDKTKTIQKLQNILQQEAKKRGYPKQDVEALELDSEGNLPDIQFTIPLWLSPNSNRYESLLNAIVTNRLLNLELPGSSFVVGSEEGFKTQDNFEGVDQSKIIWTEAWTGKLKGTRNENGTIKTAQVLVPSKFRDNNGNMLDLFAKKDGEYIYIDQKENGSYILKKDMIDSQLLSISSFRIPTSSHVSMSQIEIVGILPVEVGDLMITPKNFTRQKGLDFDVDKENTYWLHHTLDANGKIVPVDHEIALANIDEAISEVTEGIDYLKERSQENKNLIEEYESEIRKLTLFSGYSTKDAKKYISELRKDVTPSEIRDAVNYRKDLTELKTKLIQNEIIKVYSSVLGNSDKRVQEKINKVLSTDFAEGQANLIDGLIRSDLDNSMFTPLSDEYHKYKMSLGAAGKLGIGVYSNYVVLHSLIQQSNQPINLMETVFDDASGQPMQQPYQLTLGRFNSTGRLGSLRSLDDSRSVTDILAERQNTATDNEKLQIMGKTNVNEFTINVDSVLALLGFDKDTATVNGTSQEVSIPYLFLSQPVIRDYVDLMKNVKSNISGYNPNAEAEVYSKLIDKYNPTKVALNKPQISALRLGLTGQKLVDNITDAGTDGLSQVAVLDTFLELKDYGQSVGDIISKLNIQRSGLGKSIFEMIDKYNNVGKLQFNGNVSNISSLIGDYKTGSDFFESDLNQLINDGYTIFNDNKGAMPFAVKPTTVTGSLIVHSAKAGYQLWSDYFPHQNSTIQKAINDVIGIIAGEDVNETKAIELQHEVFEEMKKYLYSSSQLGIFTGNPQAERARLFFDRDNEDTGFNMSLANYVRQVVKTNDVLSSNKLITRFQYQLERGVLPSIIKFDNSKGEDFNEEYKYLALVELMDKNIPLPDYNGNSYTSRMLAKDLITYAYLEGGIQEAIQFVKYIPVPYLKEMGFADRTQLWQRAAKGELFANQAGETIDLWKSMLGVTEQDRTITGAPSRFALQYVQHNSQRLPKVTAEQVKDQVYDNNQGGKLEALVSFRLDEESPRPFVSIYNKDIKKGKSKFQLYQFDGQDYRRIPTLGVFGMNEYSVRDNIVKPLVDGNFPAVPIGKITPVQPQSISQQVYFDAEKGSLTDTITKIAEADIPGVSEMANYLIPYIKNDVKLVIGTVNGGKSRASYNGKTITLDKGYLANQTTTKEMVATTILHEYVHSLTSDQLNQYFDNNGNAKVSQLPSEIQRLHRLFKEVEKHLGTDIEEFKAWYSKNPGTIRSSDDRILYAGMDIHEFTAMIMSEPAIQKKMSEIKYMATDRSLLEQFVEAIKKVLKLAGVDFDENSVTAQAISTVFEILDNQTKQEESSPKTSIFGNVVNDTQDEDLKNLLDNSDDLDEEDSFLDPNEISPIDDSCIF